VRIGHRVRVLAQGATVAIEPEASTVTPAEAIGELTRALECARQLLGRLSGARRAELARGLQELTDAVAAALETLTATPGPSTASDVPSGET